MTYTRLNINRKKDKEAPSYVQVKRAPADAEKRIYSAEYPEAVKMARVMEKSTVANQEKVSEKPLQILAEPDFSKELETSGMSFPRRVFVASAALFISFFAVYFSGAKAPEFVADAFNFSYDFLAGGYRDIANNYVAAKGEEEPVAEEMPDFQVAEKTDNSYFADLALSQQGEAREEAVDVQQQGEAIIVSRNLSPGSENVLAHNETRLSLDMEYLAGAAYPIPSYDGVADEPLVLILHTHGTECYSDSTSDGAVRCADTERNVVRVGQELANVLNSFGIPALHSESMHDEISYITAYSSSRAEAEEILAIHPSIKYVIDLHRDAIPDDGGNRVKPCVEILGQDTAQLMLVMGTNAGGGNHPEYGQNLVVASHIQERTNSLYPLLMRPINVRNGIFNQNLCRGYMLLEVGSDANTLEEALRAVRLFGRSLAETIIRGE